MEPTLALQKQGHDVPLWRTMFVFLIPLILSNTLQSIGQLVGSIMVGRWIGVDALAAISAFFPLFFLLISFVIGIGSGSSILIAQAFGAKDVERVKTIVGTTLTFTFILGVVLAIVGGIFTWDIMRFLGTPENILAMSVHYARIIFWSLPILFLYIAYTTFIRGIGDSKTPFYSLIVSTVLNVVFLPILIFGWIGFPELGVYGAAYASVISTVLTFVITLVFLSKINHPLQFDRKVRQHLQMKGDILKLLLRLGIPSSINMILVALAEIAVITFVNRYGSDATAAFGAANQVISYVSMPAVSIGIAVSIFAAQAIGAKELAKLDKVVRAGLNLNYLVSGISIVLVYLFSDEILSLFLTSTSALEIADSLLIISLWSYLLFGNAMVFGSTMRASGTVLWPTIFSVISIWCVEVPVAYYLSAHTSLEIKGIWISYPVSYFVSLALQYAYYRLSWKKKKITSLVH